MSRLFQVFNLQLFKKYRLLAINNLRLSNYNRLLIQYFLHSGTLGDYVPIGE